MIAYLQTFWKVLTHFRGYKPQSVTPFTVWRWLSHFPRSSRHHLFLLLNDVIYFSEERTISALVTNNSNTLAKLEADGISYDHIIYVSIDRAGSSSHVMLNLLRDASNLERKGAHFVDSKDVRTLTQLTNDLQHGAIIYVDDFSGTGKQFLRNRKWMVNFVIGSFAEFFIAPCMCEEAVGAIQESGVIPVPYLIHRKSHRPLHPDCGTLDISIKDSLTAFCKELHPKAGLGFGNLATMVVFYRNAPNTMPLLFRGNLQQNPVRGIFPRSDDLPY